MSTRVLEVRGRDVRTTESVGEGCNSPLVELYGVQAFLKFLQRTTWAQSTPGQLRKQKRTFKSLKEIAFFAFGRLSINDLIPGCDGA